MAIIGFVRTLTAHYPSRPHSRATLVRHLMCEILTRHDNSQLIVFNEFFVAKVVLSGGKFARQRIITRRGQQTSVGGENHF